MATNPIVSLSVNQNLTVEQTKKLYEQIVRSPQLTLDDFINQNEMLIIDLIEDSIPDDQDVDAMYIYKCTTYLEWVVELLRDFYTLYLHQDDLYLSLKKA